jgi:hypothetical protein
VGNTKSPTSNVSVGQLKGSARGALICALFGSAWMYWAVVFSGNATTLWFAIVTIPAVALVVWGIRRARTVRRLSLSAADVEHWTAVRKLFWIDCAVEWSLVSVAAFTLSRMGRFDLIPQAFGVIIGLHFFPLVKVLRSPRYYWTAGIMVAGALGSLLIPRGYIRNIVGCAAIGVTLWATSFAILYWTSWSVGRRADWTHEEPAVDIKS